MLARLAILAGFILAGATATAQTPKAAAFDMQRCVNMGNSLDAPVGADWGNEIDLADFARIKAAGFDTVRVPVRWSDQAGLRPDYAIDPAFMAKVMGVVEAALAEDLNVILNIHHYEQIMETPQGELPKLVALWRQIATRFADAPDDLWFEVLNEPNNKLTGKLMQAAQTAGILAIRESNPDRIIILGGEDWSGIDSLGTNIAPPDDNIVYTFHYYDPFTFTHQGASWVGDAAPNINRGWGSRADRAELAEAVETAKAFRETVGHPVFVGEFGVFDPISQPERVKWIGGVREGLEGADIPWCLWSFSNTFALYDAETGWDRDVVEALGVHVPPVSREPGFPSRVMGQTDAAREDAPWGTFYKYFEGASYGADNVLSGVAEILPGQEIHPPHTHAEEEYLMVLEGNGVWSLNGESFAAKPGDMLYAAPWDVHGVRNTGGTVLKFVFWKWNSAGLDVPEAPIE